MERANAPNKTMSVRSPEPVEKLTKYDQPPGPFPLDHSDTVESTAFGSIALESTLGSRIAAGTF